MFKKLVGLLDFKVIIPIAIVALIIIGIAVAGAAMIKSQKAQIALLTDYVGTLKEQNDIIIAANETLATDMKAIKVGIETFGNNIQIINESTKQLSRKLSDPAFKKMIREEIAKAQSEFNALFNDYMLGINDDTKRYSK